MCGMADYNAKQEAIRQPSDAYIYISGEPLPVLAAKTPKRRSELGVRKAWLDGATLDLCF